MDRMSMLEWALRYADHGWRVVSVWRTDVHGVCNCPKGEKCKNPGKHPRPRHGVHGATTDEKQIKRWQWSSANIGIATGPESGIIVLDVDPRNGGRDAIRQLIERFGKLPKDLLVNTGGGGWHLYLEHPDGTIRSGDLKDMGFSGVDVKAADGMVVAPPSVHFSGKPYAWNNGHDRPPPALPTSWLDFLLSCQGSREALIAKVAEKQRKAEEAEKQRSRGILPRSFDFADLIALTIPEGPGQRWQKQWELARRLRALPHDVDLVAVFTDWWEVASPRTSGEHSYEESLGEFMHAYEVVRHPWGTSPMTELLERAKHSDPPKAVANYPTAEFRILASLCRELQREAGDKPFYLSSHKAAGMLGKHPKVVWQWLRVLCGLGVLTVERLGNQKVATRYRYHEGGSR